METLLCALELDILGDTKYIRQLARYTRMEYVRNTFRISTKHNTG